MPILAATSLVDSLARLRAQVGESCDLLAEVDRLNTLAERTTDKASAEKHRKEARALLARIDSLADLTAQRWQDITDHQAQRARFRR